MVIIRTQHQETFFLHLYCVSVPNTVQFLSGHNGITKVHSKQARNSFVLSPEVTHAAFGHPEKLPARTRSM